MAKIQEFKFRIKILIVSFAPYAKQAFSFLKIQVLNHYVLIVQYFCQWLHFEILVKKMRGKLPLSTLCLSMASISGLVNPFSEILELKRSLVECLQLQHKERKKRTGESENENDKKRKPKVTGWFLVQKRQTLTFAHAWAKKSSNAILVKCKDAFCNSKAVWLIWSQFSWFGTSKCQKHLQNKLQVSMGLV